MTDRSSFIIIERCQNGFLLDMDGEKLVVVGTDTPGQDRVLESLSAWFRRAVPVGGRCEPADAQDEIANLRELLRRSGLALAAAPGQARDEFVADLYRDMHRYTSGVVEGERAKSSVTRAESSGARREFRDAPPDAPVPPPRTGEA